MKHIPGTIEFLQRHFGLEVHYADPALTELTIELRDISAGDLRRVLVGYTEAIRHYLELKHDLALQQFVGGPLNGRCHALYFRSRKTVAIRLGPRCWAAYEFRGDPRLSFRGYASSEKKARLLEDLRPTPR